jgi:hypothetical protein
MLGLFLIGVSILAAVAILFACLFANFGRKWNSDLGSGAVRRKRGPADATGTDAGSTRAYRSTGLKDE